MPPQTTRRSNGHGQRYDGIEILTIAAGVLFFVTVAFVF